MLCQLNSHPQKCPSASIVVSASLIQLLCIWEKNERYVMMGFSFLFLSCSAFCGLIGNKIHYLLIFFALVLTKSCTYSLLFHVPSAPLCLSFSMQLAHFPFRCLHLIFTTPSLHGALLAIYFMHPLSLIVFLFHVSLLHSTNMMCYSAIVTARFSCRVH